MCIIDRAVMQWSFSPNGQYFPPNSLRLHFSPDFTENFDEEPSRGLQLTLQKSVKNVR